MFSNETLNALKNVSCRLNMADIVENLRKKERKLKSVHLIYLKVLVSFSNIV